MERIFLGKTNFKGLVRIGSGGRKAHDSWYQIDAHLRSALSDAHSNLFAEPVAAADGTMDWYGAGEGAPVRYEDLPDADKEALLARFMELSRETEAHAKGLATASSQSGARVGAKPSAAEQRIGAIIQSALSVASQPDQTLPLYSLGGQPVLVNWGTKLDTPLEAADPLEDFVQAARQRLPRRSDLSTAGPADAAAGMGLAGAPSAWPTGLMARDGLSWLAWLLFGGLLAILFLILLAPCGVSGVTGLRLCPTVHVASTPTDASTEALLAEIAALEEALLRSPVCPRQSAPATQASLQPSQQTPSDTEADRRRQAAGGQTGELTITLIWNTRADLDLHVFCPGGHLSHSNMTACGGRLDVDSNVIGFFATTNAVENVYFSQLASGAQLEVQVHNYAQRGSGDTTPYTVEITQNGERQTFSGQLANKQTDTVHTITVP